MIVVGYARKPVKSNTKLDIIKKTLQIIGIIVVLFAVAFGLLSGIAAIERAATTIRLNSGRIMRKCYNDGHATKDILRIGNIAISKTNEREPYYYFVVSDGKNSDCWTVSEDEWNKASVGDPVTR
jgi:hypothetical protein